jgi:hypothetical protein
VRRSETRTARGVDYDRLSSQPAFERVKRAVGDDVVDSDPDGGLLNIPAFLRRQAD